MAAHPERFVVADVKWTGGTEQMLDAVAAHFESLRGQQQQGVAATVPQQQQDGSSQGQQLAGACGAASR